MRTPDAAAFCEPPCDDRIRVDRRRRARPAVRPSPGRAGSDPPSAPAGNQQRRIGGIEEVSEDVDVTVCFDRGDLDPVDEPHARAAGASLAPRQGRRWCRDPSGQGRSSPAAAARATSSAGASAPSEAVVWRWRSITAVRARAGSPIRRSRADGASSVAGRSCRCAAALDEQTVLADQQLEMGALFVGEFEKDLLALGILELLAVALEELVRAALALDADHQRLAVVDALRQLFGAGGEQAVRRPLEEQERRARFEFADPARAVRV